MQTNETKQTNDNKTNSQQTCSSSLDSFLLPWFCKVEVYAQMGPILDKQLPGSWGDLWSMGPRIKICILHLVFSPNRMGERTNMYRDEDKESRIYWVFIYIEVRYFLLYIQRKMRWKIFKLVFNASHPRGHRLREIKTWGKAEIFLGASNAKMTEVWPIVLILGSSSLSGIFWLRNGKQEYSTELNYFYSWQYNLYSLWTPIAVQLVNPKGTSK